jgi:hypothetical protein
MSNCTSSALQRLVMTGEDSPDNIAKLLGPGDAGDADEVRTIHQEIRIQVLLKPPRGSLLYAMMTEQLKLDENWSTWTPREATAAENAALGRVRNIQGHIKRHMGSRSMSSITDQDMQAILRENFPATWRQETSLYTTALGAMDLGL